MTKQYIICIISAVIMASSCNNNKISAQDNPAAADSTANSFPDSVTLAFTGDVMMGTNFPKDYITPDRGKSLFVDCKDIMKNADVTIVNLEGTCYTGTDGELRKMTNPHTYYIFRMPGDHAQNLADAGVDAVNCANNHSYDFGLTGRKNTIKTMHDVGIEVAGVRNLGEGCVIERQGVKFAYISFAASCTDVLDMLDKQEIDSMINKYRKMGDVLVVTFHGGAEGTANQHVPMKEEYYVGEDRGNVHDFAHHCIDMGADIVVGHGPHVPRAVELYKNHIIAYSLGNFCAPYRMGTGGIVGYAPLLKVALNPKDGTFLRGHIFSFKQHQGLGPRLDTTNAAAENIRKLTLSDFPNTPLTISSTGEISRKE